MMQPDITAVQKRLAFACRRGMLELDLILKVYLEAHYAKAPLQEQADFETLLNEQDQDLYTWLVGNILPQDPRLQKMVLVLRQHARHSA